MSVIVSKTIPYEFAIKKSLGEFKRESADILKDARKHEHYTKPSVAKREKREAARKQRIKDMKKRETSRLERK